MIHLTILRSVLPVCLLILVAVTGCGQRDTGDDDGRPIVVVSVEPQAYFVERLAGDLVRIEVLIPPGASPATHEPTIAQLQAMEAAILYVKVGHPNFPFERTWLDRLLHENQGVAILDCSAELPLRRGDPHIWVAASTARRMVPRLGATLAELLPASAEEITRRQAELEREIDAVDAEIKATLADVSGRRFYVFHPAWGYFAADYGLEQVPIEVGAKEPDPHRLASIIEQARSDGVRVIFVQPQFSRRSAELIAAEIGGSVVPLNPLARDWMSNLRQAAAAFRAALQGEAASGAAGS